jgi:hypothetical protein
MVRKLEIIFIRFSVVAPPKELIIAQDEGLGRWWPDGVNIVFASRRSILH